MRGNFYPPEGHDFIPTQQIRDLEEYNQNLSEVLFQGKLAEFRAKTFDHLMSFEALGENSTLALYQLNNSGAEESDCASLYSDILLITSKVEENAPMFIRLIYNEKVSQFGNTSSYLIEDLSLDHEDDCQYLLDSININNGINENTPNAPFYVIQEGKIRFVEGTFAPFTKVEYIEKIDENDQVFSKVYPFGIYKELFDKIFVLQKANYLLSKVVKRIPVALQIDGQVVEY